RAVETAGDGQPERSQSTRHEVDGASRWLLGRRTREQRHYHMFASQRAVRANVPNRFVAIAEIPARRSREDQVSGPWRRGDFSDLYDRIRKVEACARIVCGVRRETMEVGPELQRVPRAADVCKVSVLFRNYRVSTGQCVELA